MKSPKRTRTVHEPEPDTRVVPPVHVKVHVEPSTAALLHVPDVETEVPKIMAAGHRKKYLLSA